MTTKTALTELHDMLEELERRKRLRKSSYTPNDGQLPIHKSQQRIRFVASGNGCHAPGTLVRMYDGTKRAVEAIKVGDLLMGPNSSPRRVIELHSGSEDMYKITPKFSNPYMVNKRHALSIFTWQGDGNLAYSEPLVEEYLTWGVEKKRRSYQWKPEAGIEYPEAELPTTPYLFGVWLGDGHSNTAAITTMDSEILNAAQQEWGEAKRKVPAGRSTSYFFHRSAAPHLPYGEKHIPHQYATASRAQRLELLAGILDTDGHLSNGTYFEIIQRRENLAREVRELAQGLGFNVSLRPKIINKKTYWRVNINGPIWAIPTRLPHKQAKKAKQQRAAWREPFSIEPAGRGRYYGFEVDNDHLFLLADYTVQRNSGKTTAAVHEAVWACLGYNPILKLHTKVPAVVAVVLDKPSKADDVWLPEMKKWFHIEEKQLHKRGKANLSEITFPNGSKIVFFSHEQDPLTFESLQIDCAIYDEPPPRHVFIALSRGTRKKGTRAWHLIIGTPLAAAWLRKELWEPWAKGETEDVECFRMDSDVNRANINWEAQTANFRFMSEKEELIRRKGQFFDLEGQALAHLLDPTVHILPPSFTPDPKWPCVVAIDPHPSKKHHAVMIASDRHNQLYVIKETAEKLPAREFARHLKKWMADHRVITIVIDSLGQTDGTGGEGFKSFIEVLREEGVRGRATTFEEKNDESFIARVQDVLLIPEAPNNFGQRVPKLRFHPACTGSFNDCEQVEWQRDKLLNENKPKLNIANTDYLSCIKYALATNPAYGKHKAKAYSRVKGAYGMETRGERAGRRKAANMLQKMKKGR